MIAGFNSIKDGEFYFDDTKINNMEPSKRNIGMVFQNYAIFPHLTVRDNVAFGLKQKKVPKEELIQQTNKYLELMQIAQYADRKPGGQQQRVTLACALAVNLSVLLMDEPLSNLEAKLRLDMRQAIREIQHEVGITTVYVTHDQEEAMAISDQIAVMKDGVIQQIGRPKKLYHKPANEFVATFIGRTNIIPANLEKRSDGAYIVFSDGYALRMPALDQVEEQAIHVSIRPEEFIKDESGDIEGTISDSVYLGLNTEYFIETGFASKIQVSEESTFEEDLQKGNRIRLRINTQKLNIFSADGSQNLIKGVNHGM
ncbi:ATP-binding component of ABC transporter [Streptococcus pneumoniae]|nr:ATP-binding component of ABC transporter [Streptococcus pneumoniae]VPT16986.1 ATP-binding component of ABC transporter [Streptococcus pneumoniae]